MLGRLGVLVVVVAAMGCGSGANSNGPKCSSPTVQSATPTHRAVIAYDQLLEGPAPPGSYPGNSGWAMFLDHDGVAYFGRSYFVRIGLDGHVVASSSYPPQTVGDGSMAVCGVVQNPTGYGAVLCGDPNASQNRLCLMVADVWPDVATCATVPTPSGPLTWDGTAFQLFSRGKVTTYDATGTWVEDRPFPDLTVDAWPRTAWYLGDNVVFDWYGPDSAQCNTELVSVVPGSLDADAGAKYEPVPTDFSAKWLRGVAADTFAAFLAMGACVYRPDYAPTECHDVFPYIGATFLTVIGPDGQPQLLRQPVPIPDANQLTWDGENLVAIRHERDEGSICVWVFDVQGTMVRVACLVASDDLLGEQRCASDALLVAVVPNDYIVVYNTAQCSTFVTRFQLVPL